MGQFGIGQGIKRFEDPRLVRGQGRFHADVNLPGQTHAVLVRSMHAHARIRDIDASAARRASGVLAVFTGADVARDGLGTMRMTRALLPGLVASRDGHVVSVTSIAGFEAYRGGAGYVAAKHAQRSILRVLRLELLGEPVRVTEVAPGMVETEFSLVRFGGDEEAARRVYAGMKPLSAEDVAECIRWAVAQPPHVNVDEIVVRPRDQAAASEVHREDEYSS